jgi:hypothetical protein
MTTTRGRWSKSIQPPRNFRPQPTMETIPDGRNNDGERSALSN